ncbi:SPASM domain-containing protein [Candidatus Woesearchaeota archaeon]|nr:SPASM domain-containing protein [Candidatus Woesearchaeota archaeon]HIH38289.1 radical SAM protein [Candidatus Woesearchaeota archaeon]HIH49137.1 radical SAM protein [Candidatus Woesearchaeota archaeon]HIJ04444.1 radical SAM protein [Candidatus Woesearchaeota archaeon]
MGSFKSTLSTLRKGRVGVVLDQIFYKTIKRHVLIPPPAKYLIESASICNLRCPTCVTGSGKLKRKKQLLSIEDYRVILKKISPYATSMTLHNWGEPLLNKDLPEMITLASSKHITTEISTNGQLLDMEWARQLVRSKLSYLIIALDGSTQEVYERYRKAGNVNRTIAGLHNITRAKKESGARYPLVEVQFVAMKHNLHEQKEVEWIAKRGGADFFKVKLFGMNLHHEGVQKLAETFVPLENISRGYEKDNEGVFIQKGLIPNYCTIVNTAMTINSDGTVASCCYDEQHDFPLGNLVQQGLKEIWYGKPYQNLRAAIRANRAAIPMCNNCPELRHTIK